VVLARGYLLPSIIVILRGCLLLTVTIVRSVATRKLPRAAAAIYREGIRFVSVSRIDA
jgi:hypothetical protein